MAITKIEVPELFDFGSDNSAFKLPTGTTAERPTSPSNGEMRFNTTTGYVEYYDTTDTQWWEIDYETLCTTNDPNYPITNLAYYKMSDATDQLGNYNGTATNVNFNVAGKFGNAGEFNGSSSYISVPTLGGSFYDNDFSISLWVNLNSLGAGSTGYLFSGAGSRDVFINFNTGNSGGGISARLYDGTVRDVVYSSAVVGNWYHVVFVRSKTSGLNLYVDGVSRDTNTFTGNAQSISFISDGIGGRVQDRNTTDGKIDQVRIFDSALDATQVTQLYNEIQCVPTIVPSENFNTVLYTGDDTNTSYTRDITGVGFDPNFVWIKDRDNSNFEHALFDSVRGAGASKILSSDSTGAEGWTTAAPMSAFITDGFSVQPRSPWNANNLVNKNGEDFVAWNWKAGGTAVSNTDGTVTSQVSANTAAGFSIVKYTGNGNNSTIGHGLSVAPDLIITKGIDSVVGNTNWLVYNSISGATGRMFLNLSLGFTIGSTAYNDTEPTSSVFTIGTTGDINGNGAAYIAYCFHSVDGFSKIGSYVGNGSATGPIITLGFEPAFVMVKNTTGTGLWLMSDNKRQTAATKTTYLQAQSSDAEYSPYTWIEYLSNGFQLKNTGSSLNTNGSTYIFMAFAADPT